MANKTGKGQFKKGDPRINRSGRPKSFDAFRELAREIAHEEARTRDNKPLVIDGHIVTTAEAILRTWATSSNAVLQQAFIAYAFGKVPDTHILNGDEDGGPMRVSIVEVIMPDVSDHGDGGK